MGPSLRPQKAQKANWRSRLLAQSSKNAFNPFGTSRKKFLLCKSTKKARYVRSLGKKPHFGAFPEAQKGVLICAICLRKAAHWPNNNANPSGLSEKTVYCVKKSAILSIRWKKPPFWGLPSGPKKLKKQTGALGCMHKAPKCIQSLWDHPKKIPFVQKYKESAICAILREKTPFWGIPRGSKRCSYLRKAAHWPNNNANPSGLSEKTVYCVKKSAILSIRWKKPPFWGLCSGPKKLKKLTGALGCMHKAPKCIQSLWDHPKKIPFVQKYKESAI